MNQSQSQNPASPAFTIFLPASVKLDAVAKNAVEGSNFYGRYAKVTFFGDSAMIESTDGKAAVRVRVEAQGSAAVGTTATVPASLLKAAAKGKVTTLHITETQCCRTTGDVQSVSARPEVDPMFPNMAEVYPAPDAIDDPAQYDFVRINPALLASLTAAMTTTQSVGLFIPRNTKKPIVATCGNAIGLLCMLTSDAKARADAGAVYRNIGGAACRVEPAECHEKPAEKILEKSLRAS